MRRADIFRRCYFQNLKPPSERTIRRRIAVISDRIKIAKRFGSQEAKNQFSPVKGVSSQALYPLACIQMDHTKIDLVIVDEEYRKPIGRPYLTLAIDVYSRCITGFCLTLDPPSAVSVALCLTHSVLDKEHWLNERHIQSSWPIWGKPDCIYVDNAAEFHSEALERGCDIHHIQLKYRPIGQPHLGGIVERVIGTFMQLIHQLPGTTFSDTQERGRYNSDKKAMLTLAELEQWLVTAIIDYYHVKVHMGIDKPPIEKYQEGILGNKAGKGRGYPSRIVDKQTFLIDFLPIERRSLQRYGFKLDHIVYYSNALSPLIADRKKYKKFIIRRDLRDLSHIYVLDPKSNRYIEVHYRTLSRPTITLWEHRQAIKLLQEKQYKEKNEHLIFIAVEKLRAITKRSMSKTKAARRHHTQIEQANKLSQNKTTNIQSASNNNPLKAETLAKRFEDIELW
jgi:putative transposase